MFKRLSWEVWLALGFLSVGFIMIGVAWNGAASVDAPESQIPYLLSGGLGGIGLIGLGSALLLFIAGRRMLNRLESKYDAVIDVIRETAGLRTNGEVTTNGARKEPSDGSVVIGRSSFHRPDCRLVIGKEDMEAVEPEEAEARGLQPCRVCEPHKVAQRSGSKKR